MRINEIIREKRRELGLTQEQAAERLGVPASAVNKWERGASLPDITLLPALARLLGVDLNTLLDFSEELTDAQIGEFVNSLDGTVRLEGYAAAFERAEEKIREYPSCEKLLISAAITESGRVSSATEVNGIPIFPTTNTESYQDFKMLPTSAVVVVFPLVPVIAAILPLAKWLASSISPQTIFPLS